MIMFVFNYYLVLLCVKCAPISRPREQSGGPDVGWIMSEYVVALCGFVRGTVLQSVLEAALAKLQIQVLRRAGSRFFPMLREVHLKL